MTTLILNVILDKIEEVKFSEQLFVEPRVEKLFRRQPSKYGTEELSIKQPVVQEDSGQDKHDKTDSEHKRKSNSQ